MLHGLLYTNDGIIFISSTQSLFNLCAAWTRPIYCNNSFIYMLILFGFECVCNFGAVDFSLCCFYSILSSLSTSYARSLDTAKEYMWIVCDVCVFTKENFCATFCIICMLLSTFQPNATFFSDFFWSLVHRVYLYERVRSVTSNTPHQHTVWARRNSAEQRKSQIKKG